MLRLIKGGILFLLLFSVKSLVAQNYYNSPYTRYLIGDLKNQGFAYNKGLGGSSIALRPQNQLNYLNPASFSAQDTTSFILQLGLNGQYANIITGVDAQRTFNMNIDYITVGFPVTNWWNASIGAAPYSRIQYFFREEINESILGEGMTFDYSGFGGFNEFYIGNSFEISEVLSLGFNASYLFGSLDRKQISYLTEKSAISASVENTTNYISSDFYFKGGIQFYPTIGEKHQIILGATYDFRSNIDVKLKGKTLRFNTANTGGISTDSLNFSIDTLAPLVLPSKIAVGFSYIYDKKLLFTAEYIKQDWTGTNIANSNFKAGLYESYRFGAEFTPAPLSNRLREPYYKRINYRLGGNYTKTYLYTNERNISDYSVSAGLGFPLKNARKVFTGTSINVGYQYGSRGTTENGLIQDKYHNFTIGLTLHDFWFLKPKYD